MEVWTCKKYLGKGPNKWPDFRTTKQRRAGSCPASGSRGEWEYAELWSQSVQYRSVWRRASSKKFGSSAQESTWRWKEKVNRYTSVNASLFLNLFYNNWKLKCTQQAQVALGLGSPAVTVLMHYFLPTNKLEDTPPSSLYAQCSKKPPWPWSDVLTPKLGRGEKGHTQPWLSSSRFLVTCAQNTEPLTSLGIYFSLRRIIWFCEPYSF